MRQSQPASQKEQLVVGMWRPLYNSTDVSSESLAELSVKYDANRIVPMYVARNRAQMERQRIFHERYENSSTCILLQYSTFLFGKWPKFHEPAESKKPVGIRALIFVFNDQWTIPIRHIRRIKNSAVSRAQETVTACQQERRIGAGLALRHRTQTWTWI